MDEKEQLDLIDSVEREIKVQEALGAHSKRWSKKTTPAKRRSRNQSFDIKSCEVTIRSQLKPKAKQKLNKDEA